MMLLKTLLSVSREWMIWMMVAQFMMARRTLTVGAGIGHTGHTWTAPLLTPGVTDVTKQKVFTCVSVKSIQ